MVHLSYRFLVVAFFLGGLKACHPVYAAEAPLPKDFAGVQPLEWSMQMADSEMARLGDRLVWKQGGRAKWDYTAGLFTLSLLKLNERVANPAYVEFAKTAIGSFIAPDGKIQGYKIEDFNIDNINPGKTVLALFRLTKEERYQRAAALLRKQLDTHPRTSEGGFWHKQRYPHQMWLDGLYMGSPFYAEYGRLFNEPHALDDVAKQFRLVAAHTYDPKTGLFYHGWDESKEQDWADKTTGTSPNFWGRALGWYAMALVDVLDFFPADHPARPEIIALLQKVCTGIVRHQDPASDLWYQVLDQGGRQGNYLEATASCMFVYTLTKGMNRGILSRDYVTPAVKGYQGIIDRLIKKDGQGRVTLTQCCSVAGLGYGRDGSYAYYLKEPVVDNDLKGVGPFILAGIELQHFLGLPQTVKATSQAREAVKDSVSPEWAMVPEIMARIQAPVFPNREFPITEYGAAANGQTDATEAIRRAIAACAQAGGGRVVVPPGEFVTGPVHLKSRVELHLEGGATLKFKTDPKAYLPAVFTRFEGMECYNYSPLIYAFEQEDIAVTGQGVLDGQADERAWWPWKGKKEFGWKDGDPQQQPARSRLMKMVEQNTPVDQRRFGEGDCLRSNFIQPYRCKNVLIEGVQIRRSPMWEIHPVLCTNVVVRGVTVVSHGPNNDGCNPESCRDVLVENCVFDTGDDCIAVKSGRDNDGRRIAAASENLIVRGCIMKDGHGGVVIGSEISGGCRNVFIEDCRMDSPNLDRALRFKSNALRGGVIENIFMRNVEIGRVAEAVLTVDFLYETGTSGPHRPSLRHVVLENVRSVSSPRVMWVVGFPGAVIDDVRFTDCTFRGVEAGEVLQYAGSVSLRNVTIEPAKKGRSLNSPAAVSQGLKVGG